MKARFEFKVRKWAARTIEANPFDIIVLDNESGKMYASQTTTEFVDVLQDLIVSPSTKWNEAQIENWVNDTFFEDGTAENFHETKSQ